ncbi:MAG: TIR domain-containing protein [Ramlibacter sp.]
MSTPMPVSMSKPEPQSEPGGGPALTQRAASGRRVAIVCRLDAAIGEAAAAFVERLGLEPSMVQAFASSGQSIDGLDEVRGADYAIVMLSANELGVASGSAAVRPEVLLEAGFLFGAVGRRRVCFLFDGPPSLGPELQGVVVHHVLDEAGVWRLLLAREMKQSGLDVDMNRAL